MDSFLATPFSEPPYFLLLTAIVFTVVFLRYLLFSGFYHYLFYRWLGPRFSRRILNGPSWPKQQLRREVWRSLLASLVFALSGTLLVIAWQRGWTRIYLDWSAHAWWYHPLSLLLALFLQDTYYYWLHRWMHRPRVYRRIHKWHHDSIRTSSLTSFSFHPVESTLQAVFVPALILFLPMHLIVLFVYLLIMTLSGTINHAGVEVFPAGAERHWLGKWIIGATHHDQHHKLFRVNFGLYFTFWDRWMRTESRDYEETFRRHTGGK
ncbi:MAG: sterol desaturase family protein [Saprospiraceae bacterium]|nr:sterol desaturase family protein [Saprospiraceae bacterium]